MTSRETRDGFLRFFEQRGHSIVPSAPVIPYDDPTLLFTNAGMNQFKDVFLGTGKRSYKRVADTQKCIRVSGKHNDLEEVGRDTYHHTFFEMLGNWSFGDYYKKEAIEWAWELLTKEWKLEKRRLWATVYKDDQEAEQLWKSVTDIDPSHVLRFGEKDNFWEMGETGPCGPCSEIHYDTTPEGKAGSHLVNAGVSDLMEIWNLVFIQFNRDASGKLTPLPAKHVDTGMGFERICAVLQNKHSNYDTDAFTPLLEAVSTISKKRYSGKMDGSLDPAQMESDIAMRVIADHVRALTFAIADGATPSNEGRGYVLRRILRRAARFGRNLGVHEPFIHRLVPTLVEGMGYIFQEIRSKRGHVESVIKGEEEGFNATLDRGLEIFEEVVRKVKREKSKVISGEDAFRLYDTFGFPLDLTQLMAQERGLGVNGKVFDRLLEEQRARSRDSGKHGRAPGNLRKMVEGSELHDIKFTGYESFEEKDSLVQAVSDGFLVLNKTPFYAESGGQVGDTGKLISGTKKYTVVDTQKDGGIIAHKIEGNPQDLLRQQVIALVDKERRISIMRNHTATHIVHEALRRVLGEHLHQSGSLVAPDHLRFDFNHFEKLTPEQLQTIEDMVNAKIEESIPVVAQNDPRNWFTIEEAKKRWPNVKMFFGEKYGERVRVVEIDPKYSVELCGGTHVGNTKEIGYFKFRSEGSIASGIRRIEAVTSTYASELLKLRHKDFVERLEYAAQQIDETDRLRNHVERSSGVFESTGANLRSLEKALEILKGVRNPVASHFSSGVFQRQEDNRLQLENLILQLADVRKSLEKEASRHRLKSLSSDIDSLIRTSVRLNGMRIVTAEVAVGSVDELKSLGDALRAKLGSGVGILASVLDEKVALVCVVTDDLIAGKHLEAGKIVGAVAKLLGGGGGGKPHLATAGGKDVAKLTEALRSTEAIVRSFLNN